MKRAAFVFGALALFGFGILVGCGGPSSKPKNPKTPTATTNPTATTVPVTTATQQTTPATPTAPSPKKPKQPVAVFPGKQWDGKAPLNVLIIGSDGRNNDGQCYTNGARADAIHIISVNPVTGEGTILNIPRDSWVAIPGYGYNKINAALAFGGPAVLTRTVEQLTGITIHYSAVTTFCSIRKLIDRLGGIVFYVPKDVRDRYSIFYGRYGCPGVTELHQGWQRLNGCQALYFSRSRYAFPGGDFDRTENQAKILVAMLKRFRDLSHTPIGFMRAVRAVRDTVQLSFQCSQDALNCDRLLRFAHLAMRIKPRQLAIKTLDGASCQMGAVSAVCLSSVNDDPNDALFRDVRTDATLNGQ